MAEAREQVGAAAAARPGRPAARAGAAGGSAPRRDPTRAAASVLPQGGGRASERGACTSGPVILMMTNVEELLVKKSPACAARRAAAGGGVGGHSVHPAGGEGRLAWGASRAQGPARAARRARCQRPWWPPGETGRVSSVWQRLHCAARRGGGGAGGMSEVGGSAGEQLLARALRSAVGRQRLRQCAGLCGDCCGARLLCLPTSGLDAMRWEGDADGEGALAEDLDAHMLVEDGGGGWRTAAGRAAQYDGERVVVQFESARAEAAVDCVEGWYGEIAGEGEGHEPSEASLSLVWISAALRPREHPLQRSPHKQKREPERTLPAGRFGWHRRRWSAGSALSSWGSGKDSGAPPLPRALASPRAVANASGAARLLRAVGTEVAPQRALACRAAVDRAAETCAEFNRSYVLARGFLQQTAAKLHAVADELADALAAAALGEAEATEGAAERLHESSCASLRMAADAHVLSQVHDKVMVSLTRLFKGEDAALARKMDAEAATVTQATLGVDARVRCDVSAAAAALAGMSGCCCPLEKMGCLAAVNEAVLAAMRDAASSPEPSGSSRNGLALSMDDVLPLHIFALLQSRPQHLACDLAYMRAFWRDHEAGTDGQRAFHLTNFEASVAYVGHSEKGSDGVAAAAALTAPGPDSPLGHRLAASSSPTSPVASGTVSVGDLTPARAEKVFASGGASGQRRDRRASSAEMDLVARWRALGSANSSPTMPVVRLHTASGGPRSPAGSRLRRATIHGSPARDMPAFSVEHSGSSSADLDPLSAALRAARQPS